MPAWATRQISFFHFDLFFLGAFRFRRRSVFRPYFGFVRSSVVDFAAVQLFHAEPSIHFRFRWVPGLLFGLLFRFGLGARLSGFGGSVPGSVSEAPNQTEAQTKVPTGMETRTEST